MAISLDNIVSGQRIKPPKIVLYGVGGIGKTTLANGAPEPIFLCTEEGLGKLDIPRFELRDDDPVLRSWQEIIDAVSFLYENAEHGRQTVVLDTLDCAEPLLWRHTSDLYSKEDIEAFGYGTACWKLAPIYRPPKKARRTSSFSNNSWPVPS